MYKYKGVLHKIIIIAAICAFFISNGALLSHASMYDTLQRDGKLRLIVKFNDFISGRISYKLAGREQITDSHLNEYILWKIDQKYNLKKLEKLFKDRELARTTGSYARKLDDYYIIEIQKDEENVEEICDAIQTLYGVDMVEPDIKVYIEATRLPEVSYIPNDTYVTSDNVYWKEGAWGQSYPDMWGLQKLQVFEAWALFSNARADPGDGIVVAVIDTGVDFSHPDLSANRWVSPNEIAGNGRDDDGNGYVDDINGWDFVNGDNDPYDGHGHGTHCSGTIAAVTNNSRGVAGIAPNARIMGLKGLSDDGWGYISWLSNCILYAANNGADVLSNSWGGTGSSSTLEDAVNYAYSRGCVIVAAAGNSNTDAGSHIPSSYANVIAVAATDHNDVRASFSNYGSSIDVSAPGVSVLSTTGGSYASWSGTSMACPHVSGVAALILSQEPSLTNAEVRARLKETADDIYGQNPGWEGKLGTGRINAYRAISAGGPPSHAPVLAPIGNKTVNEGELLSFTVSATDADGDPLIYSVVDLPGGLEKSGDANFFIQSDAVYEGTRALQSGAIEKNQFCAVSKDVNLPANGIVSFYWKVSSAKNHGILAFYSDNVKQSEISGDVNWQQKSFDVNSGLHTLKWAYSKDNSASAGADAGWLDKIIISYGSTTTYDFEDGSMPDGFTTGGHGRFYVANGQAHQGSYALMADPSIIDNQYEYVQKTVNVGSGTELSFWWKVSSEYYYDFLEFYIDNSLQTRISGDTSWQKKTYTLGAGTHTLKWQYTKDYSVTSGQDTGWVDDIVIQNGDEEVIDFEPIDGEPNPLPMGASFNPNTRTFTWTPTYQQAGTYPRIRFVVTEDTEAARSDYEDITITVNDVNRPPVLEPIGDKTVYEMELLEFTISASDPEGDPLVYSASNLPSGAAFDSNTRTFTWIPTYQQSGVYSKVHFEVTDGGSGGGGSGIDTNTKLLLHCNTETAFSDSSPGNHMVAKYGDASIDSSVKKLGTGSLKLDGSGDYLTVTDSEDWNFGTGDFTIDFCIKFKSVAASSSFFQQRVDDNSRIYFIWVQQENKIYFWVRSGGVIIAQYRYPFTPTANTWYHIAVIRNGTTCKISVDGIVTGTIEVNTIGAKALPDLAATFDIGYEHGKAYFNGWMDEFRVSKGIARWTSNFTPPASEYSGGSGGSGGSGNKDSKDITITVLDVNLTPVLNPIGNKTVNEGEPLSFTISAQDEDGGTLTYSASNLPTGAIFNTTTHTFSWTPTYTQAGTYSNVHFEVSDGKLTDSETITITVYNVNASPVLNPIGDKTVDEGSLLGFTINATDSDGDTLTYYALNLPTGASFNASTQTFNWTPTYSDAGTYYNVTFMVSDGQEADGEAITITVNNVNRKPMIDSLTVRPSTTINEGESLTIVINASDEDGDSLSYYVQNEPDGSGFMGGDFYWRPGYDQAGEYSDITFTVHDGSLYSDPYPITITVANVNDAPEFITEATLVASYYTDGEAKDVKVKGDYAYVAYGQSGLKVLDISNLGNIYQTDAIATYYNLGKIEIFGDYAYLIDEGTLVEILDISSPSMPYRQGDMLESQALDTAVNGNTAYLACGETLSLYDITDKDYPQKIEGIDLGKADKIISKGNYVYVITPSEDLKVIDTAINEVIAAKSFQRAENFNAEDIAISGNNVYIAKNSYGIVSFDVTEPTNPLENGEIYINSAAIKEIKTYNKDRLFVLGSSSGIYSIIYIDASDPTLMSVLWSYAFARGSVINSIEQEGNLVFVANQNGMDVIVSPLEDSYTIEAESELKITVCAEDPDDDTVSYAMENKPDFDEAEFADRGDGRATFTWTPTEAQIGSYEDITFTASDGYQEITSNSVTINVDPKDSIVEQPATLLLHCNTETGFSDSSSTNHTITAQGNASIDTSAKKFGTGSLKLDGSGDYLTVTDSEDWNFGTGDFTIDFCIKFKSVAASSSFFQQRVDDNSRVYFIWVQQENKIYFWVRSGGKIIAQYRYPFTPIANTWYHIAVIRNGTTCKISVDGIMTGTIEASAIGPGASPDLAATFNIGYEHGAAYFNGWIDEFRVSKGIARWTSNFTPPTTEY